MINQTLEQEQIVRIASSIGNGAHIFVPKEWLNEELIIIRKPKKSTNEQILSSLSPYLSKIKGIYLYGSQARKESSPNSDIDILVITSEKIKIKIEGFEIICLREEDISKAIQISPLLVYSILKEAIPILNSELLKKLQNTKIKSEYFKEYITETERLIKINSEFLEEDKDYVSNAVLYSILLRLRGILIINFLLNKKEYSNKLFENWLNSNITELKTRHIYEIYRKLRDSVPLNKKEKIKKSSAQILLSFLEQECSKLKEKLKND
ncbi:MAG: nucleotidyltransferase domain-containing protein [Nanoarchaeota archaeon]